MSSNPYKPKCRSSWHIHSQNLFCGPKSMAKDLHLFDIVVPCYFSSTILVAWTSHIKFTLVAWTSCIKFTLVTRPPPINYDPRSTHASGPNVRTGPGNRLNCLNPKMFRNVWNGVHPRMSKTYTHAYIQNIHAIHTHILAQVTLNILCSIHWYN